ncbi:putative pentatricopeptide repeat-containing protein at3g15130, partial [Phtheirospermum japonicum]
MGYESDIMLSNDLIDMYRKCGKIEKARSVFDEMPKRNVVSWAALMCGYLHAGNAKASLSLLNEMGFSDVRPNDYILSTSMKACAILAALESGKQIHALCSKTGLELYPFVGNSIIDMYFKCGESGHAEQVFDEMPMRTLISWNAMISGYTLSEDTSDKALHFLVEMQKRGEKPDDFTFSSGLKACRGLKAIQEGKQIHAFIVRHGYSISTHKIIAGSLVDLYAQCGRLFDALHVFDKMEVKSLVSWTALMVNYARQGHLLETMNLFRHLRMSVNVLDSFVLSSLINVFADFAMVGLGKQMHAYVIKIPYDLDVSVINSILDMYLKCGLIEEAEKLFNKMVTKNVVSYTVMITGYGKNGLGKKAVRVFEKMGIEKIGPDLVTYLAVLSACSHSGLVEESQECFKRLCNDERVKPRVEHYACMVDVLGRAGRLKEAKDVIEKMPVRA